MTFPDRFRTAARHYLLGLASACWNGGISSVAVILGGNAIASTGAVTGLHGLDLPGMLNAFAGACLVHGIFWLKAHPLPENWSKLADSP